MDTKKTNLSSNQFINGETVNYAITFSLSFFVLLAVKQLFKTFFGIGANISCIIAFVVAEVVMLLLQKFFVFKTGSSSSLRNQIIFGAINAVVHFGIYKAAMAILCNALGLYDYTVWLIVAIFIFITDYSVSRILIFNCTKSPMDIQNGKVYTKLWNNRFIALSMLIAFVGMGFMFLVFKVFPFGDTTVLRMDLYHQYGPLFVELFDRVTNHETFLYSWISGGGSSFLGNYFNYLSSPLNIFIFLFDRDQMPFAISTIVAIKCMLSAGAFTLYIKKSQKKHSITSASFGVLYAFCAYMLAYFWNIMWLDGMIMLPLIVLGIENIINKGKCTLYIVSLIYLMYSSYYIGYMMCIFSVLYFLAYFVISSRSSQVDNSFVSSKKFSLKTIYNNKFINRGIKFAVSSIFVGAVCAFFLIPVYKVLSGCSATSDSFPAEAKSYFTILDFLQSHFAGLETTIRSSGDDVLPNVYCGVLTLILVPLFVVNKKIDLREKFAYIALLLILFVSFNTNYLNFVWHAFHFPNDLPYRFSFMYSFILLVVAFKALSNLKEIGIKEIGFVAFAWIAFIAISQEMKTNKMTDFTIYATVGFIIVWAAILFLIKSKKISKFIVGVLIVSTAFCEVIISDTNAFSFNQELSNYNQNYNAYVESVNYLDENDEGFYRTELCNLNTRMDPCIYGYRGMSNFSSMAYENYSRLQYSLGMYGNRINSYTYNTQTPIYNLMYSLKYLIYNGEDIRPSTDLYTRVYESNDYDTTIYENDYFLPIAYCVNSAIDIWDTTEGNPFQIQTDFFTLATGYSDVFSDVKYLSTNYDGMSGDTVTENGTYQLKKYSENSGNATIELQATENGNMYIYLTSSNITAINCKHKD
ncbi:MAG: YfhO family protein, partial [Eubacterium sp.]|nr:YfhO family protein [Eubacterium sp.]